MTLYEGLKVYGPYKRKDHRKHVCLVKEDKRTTVSYPKYLMELHLGRYLLPNETVDHIDRDCTNDSLSNLQVLSRSEHAKLDSRRGVPQTFECFVCGKSFTLNSKQLSDAVNNRRKGSSGPFCSKSCAGKSRTTKQHNIVRTYTTLKEESHKD